MRVGIRSVPRPSDVRARPRFSVVIPAHNAAETIAETVLSVFGQSESDWELIVVDDGSTDETVDRLHPFSSDTRVHVHRGPNRGVAEARNIGARLARGDAIVFLDSDDLLMPDYLDSVGASLARDPSAGFAFVDVWLLHEVEGRVLRKTGLQVIGFSPIQPVEPDELLPALVERNLVVWCTPTIRSSVFRSTGGYRGLFTPAEDFELLLRIVAAGHRGAQVLGAPKVIKRKRRRSLSSDDSVLASALARVYASVADDLVFDASIRERALRREMECSEYAAESAGERRAHPVRRAARAVKGRVMLPRRYFIIPPREIRSLLQTTRADYRNAQL